MKSILAALAAVIVIALIWFFVPWGGGGIDLENLEQGQSISGFTVENLYVDAAGKAMGGRFLSEETGFTLDLLQIQSLPQGFFWVKTVPTSDRGEPHACEHLLLGKGRRGRYVAALEEMTLGDASAWTSQLSTVYHFNTLVGGDLFYEVLEARLDALINPDFTDEEIRREVAHIGVVEDVDTGRLTLDEKGTVYTEMVSAFEGPGYPLWGTVGDMLYGKDHPVADASGGHPDSMRTMVPSDMREFHAEAYRLSNMGLIASLPGDMHTDEFLEQLAGILGRVKRAEYDGGPVGMTAYDLPEPAGAAPEGAIRIESYPSENPEDPCRLLVAWSPVLDWDNFDYFMEELFLETFAGGAGSDLYDLFVNSETRALDIGVNSAWGWASDGPGRPIYFGLSGIEGRHMNERNLRRVRGLLVEALHQVYDLEPGGEALAELNDRVLSRLAQTRRALERSLNSPPQFGSRNSSRAGAWQDLMAFLERDGDFRKSLVLAPYEQRAEQLLLSGENIWRELLDGWGLLDAAPYIVGVRPDSDMIARSREAKQQRLDDVLAGFQREYDIENPQEAIAEYRKAFDAKTAELDVLASGDELPGFVPDPPMTLDDPLDYETIELAGGVPMLTATFENMSSTRLDLLLGLNVLPEPLLIYVPLLTELLTDIGVTKDGELIEYDEMEKRLQRELLSYWAAIDQNPEAGRTELWLSAGASSSEEIPVALGWMDASLRSPYLDAANLPRLRDLVDQSLVRLRTRMQGSEESWVNDPVSAYRYQDDPLFLSAASFLTRRHHLFLLKWRLADVDAQSGTVGAFLDRLALEGRGLGREGLLELLAGDRPGLPGEIASELRATLPDIPDENLAGDWQYLCATIGEQLRRAPEEALEDMKYALHLLLRADNVRLVLVSSSASREAVLPAIDDFIGSLDTAPSRRQDYPRRDVIIERLAQREDLDGRPVYVGLVHPNTCNGALLFSARTGEPWGDGEEDILTALTGKLYGGGGSHGFFMKTWAAGLAYSNGIGYRENRGMVSYYAERCPDVAETMRFVVGLVQPDEIGPELVDYTVAGIFGRSRAGAQYESRAESMARDLVDGEGPGKVRAFREKVLGMREREGLSTTLAGRLPDVLGRVLIGYGPELSKSDDGVFFLIGPPEQFESLEKYIASVETPRAVHRLYPRDFWLVN